MAEVLIPWTTGSGNITVTYDGAGNSAPTINSSPNDGVDREQTLTWRTTAGNPQKTVQMTIRQAGLYGMDEIVFNNATSSPNCITGAVNQGSIAQILSKVHRCRAKLSGSNMYITYLDDSNSTKYADDGSTANLGQGSTSATDFGNDVMVYIPRFYYRFRNIDTANRGFAASLTRPDATWKESPAFLVGAYVSGSILKTSVDVSDVLVSFSGESPANKWSTSKGGQTGGDYDSFASKRGVGYRMFSYDMLSTIAFLFFMKYGRIDFRNVLGAGLFDHISSGSGSYNTPGVSNATGITDTAASQNRQWVNFLGLEDIFDAQILGGLTNNGNPGNVFQITCMDGSIRTLSLPLVIGGDPGLGGYVKSTMSIAGLSDFMDILPAELTTDSTSYYGGQKVGFIERAADNEFRMMTSFSGTGEIGFANIVNYPAATGSANPDRPVAVFNRLAYVGNIIEVPSAQHKTIIADVPQ